MKKTILKLLLGASLISTHNVTAQAQHSGMSVNISAIPQGRNAGGLLGCSGNGTCMSADAFELLTEDYAERSGNSTYSLYKTENNKIVLLMPKALMNSEQQAEFQNREAYYLDDDVTLKKSMQYALHQTEPITLQKGWHTLLETKEHFIINYNLKSLK